MALHLTLQLAATAALVALLPLSVVWAATDAERLRKLAAITLFLTFDLIVFGAYTRLTDSGLGCPDWPGCYGQSNPLLAHADINAAQAAMPSGPVTVFKAWIEMIHRYLAMSVGILIVALMVVAWRRWWQARRTGSPGLRMPSTAASAAEGVPWLPTFLFGFVCLQGAFGAWTVTMKLQPVIVTIHLLMGMGLLGLLAWLRAVQDAAARPQPLLPVAAATLRWPALLALVVLALQLALGGWVSTNYATLACSDFPLCHGAVVPEMNLGAGFTLWRRLGMTAGGDYLPFAALTAIHWVHRNFALVVALVVGWVALRAVRIDGLRNDGLRLFAILLLQLSTGVATIYLQFPLALAVLHNAGAALLVLVLVMLNYKTVGAARGVARRPELPARSVLSTQ